MTEVEFKDLVKRMRQAQKDYFRERTPTRLNVSKDLERRVDEALKPETTKPALFGG